jgi:hypothetical protein
MPGGRLRVLEIGLRPIPRFICSRSGNNGEVHGGIMTLPLRAGVGWTRFVLRAGVDLAGCAGKAGGKVVAAATGAVSRSGDEPAAYAYDAPPAPAFVEPAEPTRVIEVPAERAPVIEEPAAPVTPPVEEPAEPAHVSEEPELVSELAEPGAEDGAGASITIAEPWPGYDQMQAKQVISRLAAATPAELAAIQLYESSNRDRQTVRAAAQRSLKTKTGRGSPDREE